MHSKNACEGKKDEKNIKAGHTKKILYDDMDGFMTTIEGSFTTTSRLIV